MAVLIRRGAVVWSRASRRMTLSICAIDATDVTLNRWLRRSVFVPLERVDWFDVALTQGEMPEAEFERPVLLTRDGKTISVQRLYATKRGWWGRIDATG